MAKAATASANPNFGSILDTPSAEIERPKPFPAGTYLGVIKGLPRFDKSSKKQTEFVEFVFQPTQAGEDVDADALEEFGGIAAGKTMKATYYLTEDSIWRLKKFLDDCGIEEGNKSLRQRIDQTPNAEVKVFVKHEPSQDGQSMFAKIGDTAPAE